MAQQNVNNQIEHENFFTKLAREIVTYLINNTKQTACHRYCQTKSCKYIRLMAAHFEKNLEFIKSVFVVLISNYKNVKSSNLLIYRKSTFLAMER